MNNKPLQLKGKKFGKLTVIKQVPKPEGKKSNGTYWLCRCDCGNDKVALGFLLNRGSVTSCGCERKKVYKKLGERGKETRSKAIRQKMIEKVGQTIRGQKVLEVVTLEDGFPKMKCIDVDTGEIRYLSIKELNDKKFHEPPAIHPKRMEAYQSVKGKRFGRLVVKDLMPDGKVRCVCDCGNEAMVRPGNLKNGYTKSCGCLRRETAKQHLSVTPSHHGRTPLVDIIIYPREQEKTVEEKVVSDLMKNLRVNKVVYLESKR